MKGTLNHHDSRLGGLPGAHTAGWSWEMGQSRPTGGIVGRVRLAASGAARVDWVWVSPAEVLATGAGRGCAVLRVAVLLTNNTGGALDCTLRLHLRGAAGLPVGEEGGSHGRAQLVEFVLPGPGPARVDLEAQMTGAALWWEAACADMGQPSLYSLTVTVEARGRVSSSFETEFGVRSSRFEVTTTAPAAGGAPAVSMDYVHNGHKVFIRAVNYIPVQHWARLGRDFFERDMSLVREAHLHAVGVHAHVQVRRWAHARVCATVMPLWLCCESCYGVSVADMRVTGVA